MANGIKFAFSLDTGEFHNGVIACASDVKKLADSIKSASGIDFSKGPKKPTLSAAPWKKNWDNIARVQGKGVKESTEAAAKSIGQVDKASGDVIHRVAAMAQNVKAKLDLIRTGIHAVAGAFQTVSAPAAETETIELAFESMLGSADAAKEHVAGLVAYASTTPFAMDSISNASKTMTAFGIATSKSNQVLRQLGDIAAISGGDLGELARLYGKVSVTKIDTEVVNQLAQRQVNFRSVLKELRGWSDAEFQKALSGGKLGISDLDDVLKKVTGEGGMFENGAQRLAGTFSGLMSTLGDNIKLNFVEIGKSLNTALKPAITGMISMMDKLRPAFTSFGKWVAGVVTTLVEKFTAITEKIEKNKNAILAVVTPIFEGFSFIIKAIAKVVNFLLEAVGKAAVWIDDNVLGGYYQEQWRRGKRKDEREQREAAERAAAEAEKARKKEEADRLANEAAEKEAAAARAAEATYQEALKTYEELSKKFKQQVETWKAQDAAKKFSKQSLEDKRWTIQEEAQRLELGYYVEDIRENISKRLTDLAEEGAKSPERNKRIEAESKRLITLRAEIDEWEKQRQAMIKLEWAREGELAAMEAQLLGMDEAATRLREEAAMMEQVAKYKEQGYEQDEALELAAQETAMKRELRLQKEEQDASKPNVIAAAGVNIGNGGKFIDLTQQTNVAQQQLSVQQRIFDDVRQLKDAYINNRSNGYGLTVLG